MDADYNINSFSKKTESSKNLTMLKISGDKMCQYEITHFKSLSSFSFIAIPTSKLQHKTEISEVTGLITVTY